MGAGAGDDADEYGALEGGGGRQRYSRVLSLLTEVRDGLLGLTTNAQFSEEVCDALDIELLQQQMENGALDNGEVLRLLQFVVEKIIELDAPAYEEDSRGWLASLIESLESSSVEHAAAASPESAPQHGVTLFADFLVEVFAWLFAKLEQIRVRRPNRALLMCTAHA